MTELPKIATTHSIKINVEKGKTYYWCSCGLSAKQPFCDGSHKGTDFAPITYTAEEDKLVGFCGCKLSAKSPLCDGAHKSINNNG
jgi:CDGSH-type Zn-finger protein